MAVVKLLGTSNAVASEGKENSHLAVLHLDGVILVDCPGSPMVHLHKSGIQVNAIQDVILTHFHPDHVGGMPLLLMGMWLLGRKEELHIYGLDHCLNRLKVLMDLYGWKEWPDFFEVKFHSISGTDRTCIIEHSEIQVHAVQVCHIVPAVGLRFQNTKSNRSVTYSCDTEPCESIISMARGSDVLIHEANGAGAGHSSASQAAEVAVAAAVGELILIHFSPDQDTNMLLESAQNIFPGVTDLAQDMMEINF